jgi:hypothetical protein
MGAIGLKSAGTTISEWGALAGVGERGINRPGFSQAPRGKEAGTGKWRLHEKERQLTSTVKRRKTKQSRLKNAWDVGNAQKGIIPEKEVRAVTVNALVDTGAHGSEVVCLIK